MYTLSDFTVAVENTRTGQREDFLVERVRDAYEAGRTVGFMLLTERHAAVGEYLTLSIMKAR